MAIPSCVYQIRIEKLPDLIANTYKICDGQRQQILVERPSYGTMKGRRLTTMFRTLHTTARQEKQQQHKNRTSKTRDEATNRQHTCDPSCVFKLGVNISSPVWFIILLQHSTPPRNY